MSTRHDDWDPEEGDALSGFEDQLEAVRRRHAGDPSLEMLLAAHAHLLPEKIQTQVGDHLEKSEWSRTLAAGVDDAPADQAIDPHSEQRVWRRIQEQTEARPRQRARAWPRWVYGATALAASILVAVVLTRSGDTPAAVPAAPSASPQPSVPAPAKPAEPLAFSKPEIKLSPSALTWRSGAGRGAFQRDLKPAIDAYRIDDYATADRLFAALESKYPRAVEVSFYGGVSRMLRGDFAGAIAPLEKTHASKDTTFTDDATWYLAVAEQRTGRDADALRRLTGLCSAAGPLAAQACAAEKSLRDRNALARP